MASNAKIVLRKKSNKEGLFPLAIRITKNRSSTYQYIGHYIELKNWDEKNIRVKKSHPNYDNLNNLIAQKFSEVNKALIKLQSENKNTNFLKLLLPKVYHIQYDVLRRSVSNHFQIYAQHLFWKPKPNVLEFRYRGLYN